jgi:DNA (cytosine-5)-methyltransferase 1
MGLPAGWVTGTDDLTQNQQITALGNGVQPLQAARALSALLVA